MDRFKILLVFILPILVIPTSAFALTFDPMITIPNPTPQSSGLFGVSVDLDKNTFVVGARNNAGTAYLFDLTTRNILLTILNPSGIANDRFSTVSIDGDNLLVGADSFDTSEPNSGAAYFFDLTACDGDTSNGGTAGDKICEAATITLLNPTPGNLDSFGGSLSLFGSNALVGATGDDTDANNSGAVYFFDLKSCDDDTSVTITSC